MLQQVKDTMLPAYEKQVLAQVQANITGPHAKEVSNLLNAFQVELLSLQETSEGTGRQLKTIEASFRAEKDARSLTKSQKPKIKPEVSDLVEKLGA